MPLHPRLQPKQFIEVYRGFANVSPDTLDTGQLGRHWTTNRMVAESFANDSSEPHEPTTVVTALVRGKNVIQPGTEEWDREAGRFGADWNGVESEVTVRPGSLVHVMDIEHSPNADAPTERIDRQSMTFGQLRKFRA